MLKDLNINTEMNIEECSTTITLSGIDENRKRNFVLLTRSDWKYSFDNINSVI